MDKETRSDGIAGLIVLTLAVCFFVPPLLYVLRGENLFSTNNTINFVMSAIATVSLTAPLVFVITWARVALRDWHWAYKAECKACLSRHCKLVGHEIKFANEEFDSVIYVCSRCKGRWRVNERKMADVGLTAAEMTRVHMVCLDFLDDSIFATWWMNLKINFGAMVSNVGSRIAGAVCGKTADKISMIYAYLEKSTVESGGGHDGTK